MLEYAVIGLAVILALAALGAVVVLLLSFRTQRPFEPAVPEFVPDNWGPMPRWPAPGAFHRGGDRPQANPERDPAIERGIQDRRR